MSDSSVSFSMAVTLFARDLAFALVHEHALTPSEAMARVNNAKDGSDEVINGYMKTLTETPEQ